MVNKFELKFELSCRFYLNIKIRQHLLCNKMYQNLNDGICNLNVLEDEFHLYLVCPAYNLKEANLSHHIIGRTLHHFNKS